MNERRYSKQKMLLASSKKTKVLLVGHPYNLYDNYIGSEIIKFLENEDIDILYSIGLATSLENESSILQESISISQL